MFDEQVLWVNRYKCNLDSKIPLSYMTFISMLFANKALRHEFSVVETENYLIFGEVSSKTDCPHCGF